MPRRPAEETEVESRRAECASPRAPRAIERLAAWCLRADAHDSRLGDLSEQYVRHFRDARSRLGGDGRASALARLAADARYVLAAVNVALCARVAGPGLPLAAIGEANAVTAMHTEEAMARTHVDAARWTWTQATLVLTAAAFLVGGAADLWFAWRQAEALMAGIQREKAEAAAAQIEQFVAGVQEKVVWATDRTAGSPEQRRVDALRLLRQVPEIAELAHLDAEGRETLRVSRFARDTIGSASDFANDVRFAAARRQKAHVSNVYYRAASEPYVSLAIARGGADAGVTLAEVSLRKVADRVRAIAAGETGYAYVVDADGRLIAGPDPGADLQQPGTPRPSPVAPAASAQRDGPAFSTGLAGVPVLAVHAVVPTPGWRVFVEVPSAEARMPLWNALWRGMGVLALGLAAVVLAGRAAHRGAAASLRGALAARP